MIYSKQKAKRKRDALADLRNKLKSLQSAIANFDGDNETMQIKVNEMQDTKLALDLYALHEIEGAQTKSRWKLLEAEYGVGVGRGSRGVGVGRVSRGCGMGVGGVGLGVIRVAEYKIFLGIRKNN